jgi:phosphate transport system protein
MSVHFEQEVDALKRKLLTMASHAEEAVNRAVKALLEQNDALASQVKADDDILDQFEIEIDETAIALLAKAPLATDLRLIAMAMKINHELERVGDSATTIARRALEMNRESPLKEYVDIPRMKGIVLLMLKDALDAFVSRDLEKARSVIPRDKEVDAINKQLHRELASFIVEAPKTTSTCLNLMVISKSLERIGDHAKNVAEDVVYLYEGHDIRHTVKAPEGGAA